MPLKKEQKVRKLVLVLTLSMLVIVASNKAIEDAKTIEIGENSEYSEINLVQISYIQFSYHLLKKVCVSSI